MGGWEGEAYLARFFASFLLTEGLDLAESLRHQLGGGVS